MTASCGCKENVAEAGSFPVDPVSGAGATTRARAWGGSFEGAAGFRRQATVLKGRDDRVRARSSCGKPSGVFVRVSAAAAIASRSKALRACLVSAGGAAERAFITPAEATRVREIPEGDAGAGPLPEGNAFTSAARTACMASSIPRYWNRRRPGRDSRPWHVLASTRSRTSSATILAPLPRKWSRTTMPSI